MSKRGRPPADDVLTPAEWTVVEGVRHGLSNPQIARRLQVSTDAVKYHVANVLQKLGFSSRAQLRRWPGIRRASALHRRSVVMPEFVGLDTIGQIARSVRDVAAAEAWYRDVLGMRHLYTFGKLSFFDCGGTRLFLSENESTAAESILYFRVDDIHAAQSRLAGRGVEFLDAPHLIHRHADGSEEWMAFFKDPEGRPLALMSVVAAS
jgi:DNA-binding CsgD family transcriptional regulator/catechol 2,3-dioxygenase-like lactoylglutathione lyase family enzyme